MCNTVWLGIRNCAVDPPQPILPLRDVPLRRAGESASQEKTLQANLSPQEVNVSGSKEIKGLILQLKV